MEKNYFQLYRIDHPLFDLCTLYLQDGKGLIVVQLIYDRANKTLHWGPVETHLANDIFLHPGFKDFFRKEADYAINYDQFMYKGYPIWSVRKVMWALRMKPLKRESWEQELQGLM